MSLAELKHNATALPEDDRRALAAFLLQLGRERNEAWRDEVSLRMREMDAGQKVTQAEFEKRIGLAKN
jgi:predicted transcriptional regulator